MELDEIEKTVKSEMYRIYSEKAIEHAMSPQNVGRIVEADGIGRVTGHCGDTMEMSLRIKNDQIVNAGFWTDGCGASIACGSVTTELAKGKHIFEAQKIDSRRILEALKGLPESHIHCSVLASKTLKAAVKDYTSQKRLEKTLEKRNGKKSRAPGLSLFWSFWCI